MSDTVSETFTVEATSAPTVTPAELAAFHCPGKRRDLSTNPTNRGSNLILQLDYVRSRLISTSTWREQLASKYPNDNRNAIASALLRKLAEGKDDDVSPATRAKIVELYGPASVKAATDSCREVLFKYMPRTLDDVVTDVVARVDWPAPGFVDTCLG